MFLWCLFLFKDRIMHLLVKRCFNKWFDEEGKEISKKDITMISVIDPSISTVIEIWQFPLITIISPFNVKPTLK